MMCKDCINIVFCNSFLLVPNAVSSLNCSVVMNSNQATKYLQVISQVCNSHMNYTIRHINLNTWSCMQADVRVQSLVIV